MANGSYIRLADRMALTFLQSNYTVVDSFKLGLSIAFVIFTQRKIEILLQFVCGKLLLTISTAGHNIRRLAKIVLVGSCRMNNEEKSPQCLAKVLARLISLHQSSIDHYLVNGRTLMEDKCTSAARINKFSTVMAEASA